MAEVGVEYPVVRRAEAAGFFVRKVKWLGVDGAPDRMFAKNGRVVFIEFKKERGPVRLHQKDEHNLMRAAGIEVHVCDNAIDALRILGLA